MLWYHVYGSLWTAKIIQTNNLNITREAGWCYGIMSTVPYEQQKLYGQIILLLHGRPVGVMVSCLRFLWTAKIIRTNNLIITREAGWCYGIMSTVPMNIKNYATNNLIITREAGWCYGIMSTVPYEQQKLYRQIILLLLLSGKGRRWSSLCCIFISRALDNIPFSWWESMENEAMNLFVQSNKNLVLYTQNCYVIRLAFFVSKFLTIDSFYFWW